MAAWFTYDYGTQRVWLDDAPSAAGGHHWALCAEHAARLRPPRGWEQVDRRSGGGRAADPGIGLEAASPDQAYLEGEADLAAELAEPRRLVS